MPFVPNTFGFAVETNKLIRWPKYADQFNCDDAFLVVGEGSNLLFTQPVYNGQVILLENDQFEVNETETDYFVILGAGLNWHATVERLLKRHIYGCENLALIPGTVGAAPVQNIGAYGIEFSQLCYSVSGVDLLTGVSQTLSAKDCLFAYRDSIFKHQLKNRFLITSVQLVLAKNGQANLNYGPLQALQAKQTEVSRSELAQLIFAVVCQTRQQKLPDPKQLGNAGSFFKNPVITQAQADALLKQDAHIPCYPQSNGEVKIAAAYLIDKVGLKGMSYQQAKVHDHQALVLVNQGGASGEQIIELAAKVRQQVFNHYQVRLSPEVRFIGAEAELDSEQVLEQLCSTQLVSDTAKCTRSDNNRSHIKPEGEL